MDAVDDDTQSSKSFIYKAGSDVNDKNDYSIDESDDVEIYDEKYVLTNTATKVPQLEQSSYLCESLPVTLNDDISTWDQRSIQEFRNYISMKFSDLNSSSFTSIKKPPIKPPRRKHSIRTNSDLRDDFQSNPSSSSSALNTPDHPLFRSLDPSYNKPSHAQLLSSASLPNVQVGASHKRLSQLPPELLSSSDSCSSSLKRREYKRRRPRRSTSSICQKQANNYPQLIAPVFASPSSQWPPIAFYPIPTALSDLPNQHLQFAESYTNNNAYHRFNSLLNKNNNEGTSLQCDRFHNRKTNYKKHRRSNSDPITCDDFSSIPSFKSHQVNSTNQDKFSQPPLSKLNNQSKHSSKFAALLEEIYKAQKERDEAMLKRIKNAAEDRDKRISSVSQTNDLADSDSDGSDAPVLSANKINGNIEMIEKTFSPSEIRKHAKKLLKEVQSVKQNNKSEFEQYVEVLKNERDAVILKNKQLENEMDHYLTAHDMTMDNSMMSKKGDESSMVVDDDHEMLRICYSLQKSVMHDSMNMSQVNQSQNASDDSNLVDDLKKQLHAEKDARQAAERKCERLEVSLDLLRKKVNKMNGFDGIERSFSTSVDYF